MKTIHKYSLWPLQDIKAVDMPEGAAVLCVQVQNGIPCLWAEVEPEAPMKRRVFVTYGTGHPMNDGTARHYVGTYQLSGGKLVLHVYTDRIEYPAEG